MKSLQKRGFIAISFIIIMFLTIQVVFAYPIIGKAIKTNKTKIDAGTTPDSFLYSLDTALDNINLALTFDSGEKARKGLDVARERLMEVREMVKQNKIEAAQIAQQEHSNVLTGIKNSVKEIEKANATKEIEEEVEVEKGLEEHETEIEEITGELKVKIEVEGKVTPNQQALIDSVLANLEGKAGEVEIEIENEKGETKLKIEQETGESEEEVEAKIEKLEERTGLKRIRKEKAWDKIKDAEEEINEMEEEVGNDTKANSSLSRARSKLVIAKQAYSRGKYGKAFGQATAAINVLKNIEKGLDLEKEEKRDIEAEVKGNRTKVEVEVAGEEAEFILEITNRDKIISKISERIGLSEQEIENIMKFEVEEPEQEIEIEVEVEEGVAKVKTERKGSEKEFSLNTTKREEIISEIVSRTGLTRERVEKNAEFEFEKETEKKKEDEDNNKEGEEGEIESNEIEEGVNGEIENETPGKATSEGNL